MVLSVFQSVCLYLCMFLCLSVCLSVCLSFCLSALISAISHQQKNMQCVVQMHFCTVWISGSNTGLPLFMTNWFFDGRTDRFFGQTDFWTDGFQKKFLTDCQKEFLTDCFGQVLGHFWAIFGQFWLFLGKYRAKGAFFHSCFFLCGRFLCGRLTLIAVLIYLRCG